MNPNMPENPYAVPSKSIVNASLAAERGDPPRARQVAQPWPRRHLFFLIGFYALAVLGGIRELAPVGSSLFDLLFPVGFALCLGQWAIFDARSRGKPISLFSQFWFFWSASVLVPAYFIASRGWRAVGWIVLHAFLWLFVSGMTMMAISIAAQGADWFWAGER